MKRLTVADGCRSNIYLSLLSAKEKNIALHNTVLLSKTIGS